MKLLSPEDMLQGAVALVSAFTAGDAEAIAALDLAASSGKVSLEITCAPTQSLRVVIEPGVRSIEIPFQLS